MPPSGRGQDDRPPGAPRKQTRPHPSNGRREARNGGMDVAGPSAAASSSAAQPSTAAMPSISGPHMAGDEHADAAVAATLFNDPMRTGPGTGAFANDEATGTQAGPSMTADWLSRRMLLPHHGELEHRHTSFADTPTGRQHFQGHAAAQTLGNGLSYRTPSATSRSTSQSSTLYEHLARGMAASRRQQSESHARISLASSSGWGSPRMLGTGMSSLGTNGSLGPQRGSSGGSNASLALSSNVPARAESQSAAANGLLRTPYVASAADDQRRLHVPPRLPHKSSVFHSGAAINQDGSYSVIGDEEDANNSGLLALSPAVRRINALAMTPAGSAPSDSSSRGRGSTLHRGSWPEPESDRMGDATMIEHAFEIDEQARQEEGELLKAQLLQQTGSRPQEDDDLDSLLETMRSWREDAMKHHLYDTAIFWGDKVLSLETSQLAWNDAYNLATAYFLTHRYAQAEHLLCAPLRLQRRGDEGVSRTEERDLFWKQSADGLHSDPPPEQPSRAKDDEWDELGAALSATRSSSRLPDSLLARAKAESTWHGNRRHADQAPVAQDAFGGKRKERSFNVSGTGTESGSTSTAASVAGDAHELGANAAGRLKKTEQEPKSLDDKVAEAWQEEQSMAMAEVKDLAVLPPDSVSLVSVSVPCKYLAAQCMVRQGKYQEALDELSGWKSDNVEALEQSYRQPSKDGLIKLSSSIWHLKGLIHLHLRNVDEARESFIRSLSLDVKNFESFDQLIRGHLLSASQQWDFVENLQYVAQAGEDPAQAEALRVVRLLYTARLDKNGKLHARQTAAARRQLIGLYGLGTNPDVLLGLAEEMFARMRYEDAYTITSKIMDLSKDHEAALPVHISSMFMLERLRPTLYLLAHHLTDTDPDMAASWYAVGCWYFGTRRWLEARKHFSKCVQIDPRFAPGWIAFAHTFAYEGESDQAIISYSTAERNFSAHYLIKVFLGMEHLAQGNLTLADLYLAGSAEVWEEDALSRNERGVVAYYAGRLDEAIELFRLTLRAAADVQQPPSHWTATHLNLAFALRKRGRLAEARSHFSRSLELNPDLATAYTGVGMCFHGEGKLDEAIQWYHRALAVDAMDKHANDLLAFALQESALQTPSDLLAAADGIINKQHAALHVQSSGHVENGSAPPYSIPSGLNADSLGIRIAADEDGGDSYANEEGQTHEMSLADGSASVDMDESES